MFNLKKYQQVSLALIATSSLFSIPLYAETAQDIDPSDVARANTSITIGATNNGQVKGVVSYAFSINETQQGMVYLEGNMDKEGSYQDSRVQYFQVFNLESKIVPKIAASLDVIDNASLTSTALGAVVAVTPTEKFAMYLRAGVLGGKYKSESTQYFGVNDDSAVGGMAAGYFTYKTGSDGTFIMFSPEYTYVDGDIETSKLKTYASYRDSS